MKTFSIIKVDIATGKVLENNLETLWQQHNSNSGLKEPVCHINSAMQVVNKPIHKQLWQRIKNFNQTRHQKWSNDELYQLVELIWIENKGYKVAATRLGRSKGCCRQMMHLMREAGVLATGKGGE